MQVKVEKVEAYSEGILVKFASEYGKGFGIWNGNKRPIENESYDIEFDITDTLNWGREVRASKESSFKIAAGEAAVTITGKIERISPDGYAELRFGESLIELELEGRGILVGSFVDVEANELELYVY